jgi:uncharacterized protein YjbI with pentapeptide repeats
LQQVELGGADLRYVRFDHAQGEDIGLQHADLAHSSHHNTRFVDVDLRGAQSRRLRGTSPARLASEARSLSLEMH